MEITKKESREKEQSLSIYLNRVKSPNELAKEQELNAKVLDFYKKVYNQNAQKLSITNFDFDLHSYGYIDNSGYYLIIYDSFNYYLVSHYGDNVDEIFTDIVKNIINKKYRIIDFQNHHIIKKEGHRRFPKIRNSESIIYIEYILNQWHKFYDGKIPERIMKRYKNYINSKKITTDSIEYDIDSKRITYRRNIKKRKLVKN